MDIDLKFQWKVDQDGYETTVENIPDMYGRPGGKREDILARGSRWRHYRPLEIDGLWLQFADTCRSREGVLQFVSEFGLLWDARNAVHYIQGVAEKLWVIWQYLEAGDPRAAKELFNYEPNDTYAHPMMYMSIGESVERPGGFAPVLVPDNLESALRLQAIQAITENKQFRRCRNNGCVNWFGYGPHAPHRQTYTKRREFCSDRCRIAWARRNKREAAQELAADPA
jgi:hypothetical protein